MSLVISGLFCDKDEKLLISLLLKDDLLWNFLGSHCQSVKWWPRIMSFHKPFIFWQICSRSLRQPRIWTASIISSNHCCPRFFQSEFAICRIDCNFSELFALWYSAIKWSGLKQFAEWQISLSTSILYFRLFIILTEQCLWWSLGREML